ncbi:hypothetical protein ABW636_17120 [Aquimarina sp. 2201CG1-2-11]|uniref:hypothetical protein n=1 Tax=Aquimarina discodermiae TaxID=3231043 RepID=UPI003461DE8B
MGYIGNFFVAIDQLGNVIAGGNPDNTISSRVGYYTNHHNPDTKVPLQWRIFEKIIDFTFWPIDGPHHCHEAFHSDAGETFDKNTKNVLVAILAALLIIPSCILIATLLYILYLFRIVSPRDVNRNNNIKNRLHLAKAKLEGTLHELNEHKVVVDDELRQDALATILAAQKVSDKINGMLRLKKRAAQQ